MKNKTTINKFRTHLNLNISKLNILNSSHLPHLVNIKKTFVSFLLFISAITFGQSGCNAILKVENDTNSQSSSSTAAALYIMVLTNNSSSADSYSLNALNVNNNCSNTDGSSTAGNINLEAVFLDINQQPISNISIGAGQSINFFVKIIVPDGTAFKKWSCTQVNAVSNTCPNYKVNTVLHTLVINPNEE